MNDQFKKWAVGEPPSLTALQDALGRLGVNDLGELRDLLQVATKKPWPDELVKAIRAVIDRLARKKRATAAETDEATRAIKIRKMHEDNLRTNSKNKLN